MLYICGRLLGAKWSISGLLRRVSWTTVGVTSPMLVLDFTHNLL